MISLVKTVGSRVNSIEYLWKLCKNWSRASWSVSLDRRLRRKEQTATIKWRKTEVWWTELFENFRFKLQFLHTNKTSILKFCKSTRVYTQYTIAFEWTKSLSHLNADCSAWSKSAIKNCEIQLTKDQIKRTFRTWYQSCEVRICKLSPTTCDPTAQNNFQFFKLSKFQRSLDLNRFSSGFSRLLEHDTPESYRLKFSNSKVSKFSILKSKFLKRIFFVLASVDWKSALEHS